MQHAPLHKQQQASAAAGMDAGPPSAPRRPPNLPTRLPDQFGGHPVLLDAPQAAATQDPEARARRPGWLTIGATAKVVLAIATLEGGLALKILYKARRRRAPRSHLSGPAAAAAPLSPTQPLGPPPSPPASHNAARAPPKIARSPSSARTPEGPGTLRD